MKKKLLRTLMATLAIAGTYATASAQIPEGYYNSLKGKKGAELKTAVYEIIKDANVLDYGSGYKKTWWGFWQTDRTSDGRYIDRYSPEDEWPQSTTQGAAGSGMNIEHSFPKSWWGGSKNQAYQDLYNLMPCESSINTKKSNYPMGAVTNANIADNGATKVGTGNDGKKYWEPADEWKGDFARGYMYMATCYQNLTWSDAGLQILESDTYPTLRQWAYKLYIDWAKADKPTQLEITRNNAVSKIQGNRNPFVDFPNLMEYIWGDSIDYAFDPAVTECSANYPGGDTPVIPGEEEIKSWKFTQGDGGFTIENAINPLTGKEVWTNDSKYGWKGTAYAGKAYAADATLVSPEIDLTTYSTATLSFKHVLNYMKEDKITDRLGVEVRCDGQVTQIADKAKWPDGNSWTSVESGDISLDEFAGKKIQIAFRYTSTSEVASTWEILSMYLNGKKATTAISGTSLNAATFNASEPFETYTIDGKRTNNTASKSGIVVIKQNGKTWKMAR